MHAELGEHFFHEASTYASWQTEDISSAVHSYATTPEELRAEGIYQVLSPDQVVERIKGAGDEAFINLHPLVGGMPIDEGWKCLQLYVDDVLPRYVAALEPAKAATVAAKPPEVTVTLVRWPYT